MFVRRHGICKTGRPRRRRPRQVTKAPAATAQRAATAVPGAVPGTRARENGDGGGGEGGLSEMDRRQRELYAKQQQLLREQRSQDQEKLLACISGFPPLPPHPQRKDGRTHVCTHARSPRRRTAAAFSAAHWNFYSCKQYSAAFACDWRAASSNLSARIRQPAHAALATGLVVVAGDVGFHRSRPLAAMVIFRCCLQWKAFQADRTSLFDKIINTMGTQVPPPPSPPRPLHHSMGSHTLSLYPADADASARLAFGVRGISCFTVIAS